MSSSHTDPDLTLRAEGHAAGRIIDVDPDRRREAVQRLVAGSGRLGKGHAERFLAFAEANGIVLDSMWATLDDGGAIEHTVLAVPNPGRTALFFASTPAVRRPIDPLANLIEHACQALMPRDTDLGQVLLDPTDRRLHGAFTGGGFTELAQLSYLERGLPVPAPATPDAPPEGCTLTTYDPSDRGALLEVLKASYEDTLDCPGLRGLRRTEDILVGHEQTGEYDPRWWTLLRIDGVPQGALLLNRAPASQTIELVYVGLARAARGRGFGRLLLRHGLRSIRHLSDRAVTLAVDERNAPALALYRSEGFRRVMRRIALIRSLRGGTCG